MYQGVIVRSAKRLSNISQIATRRPRLGEVGVARRCVAHGCWFQLISVLLYVDK